ncbi:MAG: translation initiation factor 2 [Desulfovibrionaceae bacterium]|nr:translation initiation factor 2 [Desulfovibrionaceae bacterium]
MHNILLCLVCLCALVCLPNTSSAAQFARNLATSLRDMEYFYKHQEPKTLAGMLRAFDREHKFAKGELRLTTAAFLAEVFRKEPIVAKDILQKAQNMSREAQTMLLWAIHLSKREDLQEFCSNLHLADNQVLCKQISSRPRDLTKWDLTTSNTILHMYWGAFFAYADLRYLDAIIDAAVLHARLKSLGRTRDAQFSGSMAACASLYEMTPRHPLVRKRLSERLTHLEAAEVKTLSIILNQN